MRTFILFNFSILFFSLSTWSSSSSSTSNYNQLTPHLKFELTIELPNKIEYLLQISNLEKNHQYQFYLNKGLHIQSLSEDTTLSVNSDDPTKFDLITRKNNFANLKISGELLSPDAVGPDTLLLNSGSYWFPNFNRLHSYDLIVHVSKNLVVFNPNLNLADCGENCFHFIELNPQDDINLAAGKYTEYQRTLQGKLQGKLQNQLQGKLQDQLQNNLISPKKIGVLLLSKDDELAQKYLDLLPEFLSRYEMMFGEYPYPSFYVIENFNQTGYGMPGFTLLGSSVIRLPFILRSSLPHEVLHSWWGNGVFVDPDRGNWCEGLTTYGADHFEQELLGLDANYRRDTLLAYEDFVNSKDEFPLNKFKERHDEASQSVGYGKGMMLFHMLKKWIGVENFNQGLKDLYGNYRFRRIGFEEIQKTFAHFGDKDAHTFMHAWINDLGQTEIKVHQSCNKLGNVEIQISSIPPQFQYVLPYSLFENNNEIRNSSIKILNGNQKIELPKNFSGSISLDSKFDVFRKLSAGEKPLTMSRFLSSEQIYVIAQDSLITESQLWIQGLKQSFSGQVIWVKSLNDIPHGAKVIFYGFNDLSMADSVLQFLSPSKISLHTDFFVVDNQKIPMEGRGWLLMSLDQDKDQVLVWAKRPDTVLAEAWGKQLSHYSKFGILFFNGKQNEIKTAWSAGKSQLDLEIKPCNN